MINDSSSGRIVRMARRAAFSSAHFYSNKSFSAQENQKTFGRCFTEHGHGHNYILEAYFEGPINADTGLIVNLIDVDILLKEVVDHLDHHHLNFDIPEFMNIVPTTEVLARYCFSKVQSETQKRFNSLMRLYKVRLFEAEDLWVEYGERR